MAILLSTCTYSHEMCGHMIYYTVPVFVNQTGMDWTDQCSDSSAIENIVIWYEF